ncbi:ZYRO0E09768p [Zygosaccharomyces rouxii]|uniref:ZYRO0E09768p n=1 Tax=Zygosaccharomyces rouxii (strain ATCC 2623 / CBS 732 / NBRC 1130 / NCYC 568 / NRRL Y-229) TaxID=559307 RepID=C5E4Y6_ZYGRC|nr:uncharacterized protein ZYRO0E09768g [Zygosaccharomyces rouxii]KAH9198048.1 hypothetical protein LQ764DRAFT_221897 [Zygosaccharomyces rouxii]CAR31097.1 ZYRO0E09768p [Zygosaccharomyces rouxii]
MELEYWILDSSAVNSSDGGYENTFTNTKETVRLEKKSQKLLQKLSHSSGPKVQLQKVKTDSLEHFQLEAMPLKFTPKQYNIRCLPWPKIEISDNLQNFHSPKEKLKLEDESKRLFVWLTDLSKSQIQHDPIARRKNRLQGRESFKIKFEFLTSCIKQCSKINRCEFMPSVLGTRFKETLRENIPKTVSFAFGEKLKLEHHFCKTASLEDYILEATEVPLLPRISAELLRWPVPSANPNELVFEMLRSQLFDLEFNKLEFFKMDITCTQSNKRAKIKLPKNWKMCKSELKQWDWNPFKQIEKTAIAESTTRETIATYAFNPPIFVLEFHKFPYNSFDFINLEEDTFGSLKFASASRLAPTMTKKPSATSEREKTMDSTINSEHDNTSMIPHKRSFIDDDLLTILHSRKRSRKHDDHYTSTPSHGATMFRIMNQEMNRYQAVGSSPVSAALEPPKTPAIPFEPANDPRRILVNATKIRENHKIIQYLSNETQLQLVEQELPLQCDFIIDATSCIVIVQLDLFFQLQADKTMFYENTLKSLLNEFKTVVVLIKYPVIIDIADRDVFWKIRLYLQPPDFQLFLTEETPQEIGKWINMLSNEPLNDQPLGSHPLLLLHFNKFLVQELLSKYTLKKILLMAIKNQNKELSCLLTDAQLKRIQKLMALGW